MDHKDRIKLYKRVFNTDDGTRVIDDLVDAFDLEVLYKPGETHADTAHRAGRRETVVYILQMLREDSE